MLRKLLLKRFVLIGFLALVSMTGCGPDEEGNSDNTPPVDSTQTIKVTVGGKIFSIPSPVQTAILIKQVGATFNKDMLNSERNAPKYSTHMQKALNLGVYGADLGYITIYEQPEALGYFNSINTLATELGVTSAFDKTLLERFKNNLGKKDSILVLVSAAYRSADFFLKENDRNEDGALIIAGGWIESLWFATTELKNKHNPDLVRRIAEQKTTIESLVGLMETYAGKEEYGELLAALRDLKSIFDGVEIVYQYEKPITDTEKKLTTITSKTDVKITPEHITSITEKVESLRNLIVS
jgi:hypothetical protein